MFTFEFDSIVLYILVFMRMSGLILLNPVFSRRNVPSQIRLALILCLTMVLVPTITSPTVTNWNIFTLLGAMAMEFFVGFLLSFVFQLFYYMLFFAGDLLDVEFGVSMARVFDPGTNIQMAISSNLLNIVLMLYLFVTDSHLLMIKLFSATYDIIPAGAVVLTTQSVGFYLNLVSTAFSLVIRLALPFVAAIFVSEVAMGVLMKMVPQIHVFVISIQFKIMVGLILLFLFAAPLTSFIDKYLETIFHSMEQALYTLR